MEMTKLKKMVADAYAISDKDRKIPKYSTQFSFDETKSELRIYIPVYEHPLPDELFSLVLQVINSAFPNEKKKPESLRDDLNTAAGGRGCGAGTKIVVVGHSQSTEITEGSTKAAAHAVSHLEIVLQLG